MIKKGLKIVGIAVVALLVLLLMANEFIRVTYSSDKSIGVVEQYLFGRPVMDMFTPPWSENYKRWDAASKASSMVADLIKKYGVEELTISPKLQEQRTQAEQLSKVAFENSNAISKEYLANSNADLEVAYSSHFVPAMDLWQRGLSSKSLQLVQQGISEYNSFLIWIQSRKRSDFKSMR